MLIGEHTSQQELAIWQPAWPTRLRYRQYIYGSKRHGPQTRCGEGRVQGGVSDGGGLPLMLMTSRMLAYARLQEEWEELMMGRRGRMLWLLEEIGLGDGLWVELREEDVR